MQRHKLYVTSMLCREVVAKLGRELYDGVALEPIRNPDVMQESTVDPKPHCTKQQSNDSERSAAAFCEASAAQGALGRFPGREVMGIVRSYMESYLTPVQLF